MIPKHIFWPVIDCFGMYVTGVTRMRCCFTPIVAESVRVVTSSHVTKMAVTPFDLPVLKTNAISKLHDCIFYRTGVIAD